jgi:hypothetical protein
MDWAILRNGEELELVTWNGATACGAAGLTPDKRFEFPQRVNDVLKA